MGKRNKKKKKYLSKIDWIQHDLSQEGVAPWGLKVEALERIGYDGWKVVSDRGLKRLNRVNWSQGKLLFVQSLLDHLGRSGFKCIPRFIRTTSGEAWVAFEDSYFYLCDWVEGVPLNPADEECLLKATKTMAWFHYYLREFNPPTASDCRDNRGQWPKQWQQAHHQILVRGNEVNNQSTLSLFDKVFLEAYDLTLNHMEFALSLLANSQYGELVVAAQQHPFVCHNSFRETNLILTPWGKVYVSGFENCLYDLRVHDLGRFMQRILNRYNWNLSIGQKLLDTYEEVWPLEPAERKLLLAQMWFPYPSWTYIQAHYQGQTEISEKIFVAGLQREITLQKARQRFLEWADEWTR